MMLIEKMQQLDKLTDSQKAVIDFLIHKSDKIEELSAKMIAEATFTSPSTLTRLAKKLGYNGFDELKKDFLKGQAY